jgi:hypothetical protein
MPASSTGTLISGVTQTTRAALSFYCIGRAYSGMFLSLVLAMFYRAAEQSAYNMLWGVLFGFATLNILGLAARRLEPRRGLSFGEVLAVLTVVLSMFLLGWEMVKIFHVLPLKLR